MFLSRKCRKFSAKNRSISKSLVEIGLWPTFRHLLQGYRHLHMLNKCYTIVSQKRCTIELRCLPSTALQQNTNRKLCMWHIEISPLLGSAFCAGLHASSVQSPTGHSVPCVLSSVWGSEAVPSLKNRRDKLFPRTISNCGSNMCCIWRSRLSGDTLCCVFSSVCVGQAAHPDHKLIGSVPWAPHSHQWRGNARSAIL